MKFKLDDENFEIIRNANFANFKRHSDALDKINDAFPDVVKLNVGDAVRYNIPAGVKPRSYLAQAYGKLTAVRRDGQPWAGRVYRALLDDEGKLVIYRDRNGIPLPAQTGRPRLTAEKADAAANRAMQRCANIGRKRVNRSLTVAR